MATNADLASLARARESRRGRASLPPRTRGTVLLLSRMRNWKLLGVTLAVAAIAWSAQVAGFTHMPTKGGDSLGSRTELGFDIQWRVPVGCGWSGFFTEVALGFVPALQEQLSLRLLTGRCDEKFLRHELEPSDAEAFRAAWTEESSLTRAQTAASLAIEHGEPCEMRSWRGQPGRPWRVIARAMSEADLSLSKATCLRSNADEIWVPTQWHVERFVAAGLARSRLHVVPEPVDTVFFSPTYRLSKSSSAQPFVFLSNFKWEMRKGWDLLLRAYWSEFSVTAGRTSHGVRLVIKTYLPSWEPGPSLERQLDAFARTHFGVARASLPPVELVEKDVSRVALRELYAASDAFVLPTRGEGWGLPLAEAMAMGLPAIATNFSGPTAFLTEENSHPLPVARKLLDGSAEPAVADIRRAMRRCVEEAGTDVAQTRSERARADMATKFSRAAVAEIVMERLHELAAWKRAKETKRAFDGDA